MDNKKNNTFNFTKTLAFTLAEVLIVIGIIGIVAEMVIPGVIANAFDSYSLAMVKEDFSIIQQAIKMAESNEGRVSDWYSGTADIPGANIVANQVLSKYLKVVKNCGATQGCFSPDSYRWLSSSNTRWNTMTNYYNLDNSPTFYSNIILANGSSLAIWTSSFGGSGSNSYIQIMKFIVDVNGLKAPNRWGYDTFIFQVYSSPDDAPLGGMRSQLLVAISNMANNNDNAMDGCYSNGTPGDWAGGGIGCAGWAVYNSTVQYKNGELLP